MKNLYHDDQDLFYIINLINDPDYEDWSYLDTRDYLDEYKPLPYLGNVKAQWNYTHIQLRRRPLVIV